MSESHPVPDSRRLIPALVLVTGIGPFATDMYISALPEVATSLHTTGAVAQLTLTAFLIGLAGGQLLWGPISDATGRRRIILWGTAAFALTSALCVVLPHAGVFVAARLVQGVAAGAGVVVGRAVVSDLYPPYLAARTYGTLASITFLAPLLAPVLGRIIIARGSWRSSFVFLVVAGVAMLAAAWFALPESLPPERRHPAGLGHLLARMADLLRDPVFARHLLVGLCASVGFFTYIGGSSLVLQTTYRIGPDLYSTIFAVNASGMAVTAIVFRRLVGRVSPARLRAVGVGVAALASVGLLVLGLIDRGGQASIGWPWAMFFLVVGSGGFTIPASTALAQEAGRRAAGTAASLQGGLQMLVGALATPLTGLFGYDSLLPTGVIMTCAYGLAVVLVFALRRR